jgi:hypothetical protein
MPPGIDDYDIVIGVTVSDQTAPGSASVKSSLKKTGDDIRSYSDRQARDIARNSRDLFSKTDQDVSRSATGIVKRLAYIFDTHNFLLRNMARQAGSTTGAMAIGIGKIALSYQKMGKDSEDAASKGRIAMTDLKTAVSRLGTDSNAFPSAIKAARDLSIAYEQMGLSGHAASVKAGAALEESVHKRVTSLQGGLAKAQSAFEKLQTGGSANSEKLARKVNEISASVSHLLGGVKVDSGFFKAFIKAKTDTEKYLLVLDKLGPKAAVAFASNQGAIDKLSSAFVRLESRAAKSLKTQSDRLSGAAANVKKFQGELLALEKGMTGLAGGTEEATSAAGGLSTSLIALGASGGIVLAVILLVVAAVVGLGLAMYKGATTAAAYGDELYKLSLSTGLSVKTLSALNIIAKETNTEVDSLAKTFTRAQIQIQKGVNAPFSEAARAIRTLGLNAKELRKLSPDEQVFKLAKAFDELRNQNVRAMVSQQLFSRDSERQAKMMEQIATGFDVAQKKAKKYGLELDESGAVKAHAVTVAITDMKLAWEGLWVSLGVKILPQLTALMESFTDWVLKSGGAFEFLGKVANFVLREIRIQLEIIKSYNVFNGGSFSPGNLVLGNVMGRGAARAAVDQQDKDQKAEFDKRIEELKKRGLQSDQQYAPGKGQKSPLDRLLEQIKRLRFEIQALQDVGSREFVLRFHLETLEKVKSGFETIFKLRNEMGLVMDQPAPQFRIFGTPEEQQQDLANLQSYVKQIERMKSIFEDVRKVANEQSDALAELAKVQQETLMPVVDAGTLAEIKYQTAIRNRVKAERELTSDVIAETKLRKDAVEDEVGNILRAYMTLQRDIGRSQDQTREQRAQDEMFVRIVRGDFDTEGDIRKSISERMGNITPPQVPTELMTIAAHAATIDLNVSAIAEKIGANVTSVTNTSVKSPASQTGYAMSRLVVRNPDGSVSVKTEDDLNADTISTSTTDINFLRKKIFDEARSRAGGERVAAERKANQSIIDDQMRMEQSLIGIDTDYLQHYQTAQVSRRASARETEVSIMLLENDLKDLSNSNSELYKRTWKDADKARLESLRSVKDEIIGLQNEIVNNGFDQNERLEKARLQSIRDIQVASNQAKESIVYNQVQIGDSTVYHAERADAAVMDFIAHQRSLTDVIADARISVIQNTFDIIGMGLDKALSKFGIMKSMIKDILMGFIQLGLRSLFLRQGFAASSAGGGGGILGGVLGGGFGGGLGITQGGGGMPAGIGGVIQNFLSGGIPGSTSPAATPSAIGSTIGVGGIPGTGILTGTVLNQALPKFGFSTTLAGLAPMFPLLGAGLGVQLGGQSRFGNILGGIGGLAGGLAGLAGVGALSGLAIPGAASAIGLAGSIPFLGPLFAGLGGSIGGGLGAFVAAAGPFAAIAAPLIIGAIIFAKNKARQQAEKIRNQANLDTLPAIYELLNQARTGDITVAEAKIEWEKIHQDYLGKISGIKDSKTKRNALLWWDQISGTVVDPGGKTVALWPMILAAAEESEHRGNIRNRMHPVFASGGISHMSQWIKVRPGEGIQYPGMNYASTISGKDYGYDSQHMFVPKGTKIITKSQMQGSIPMALGGVVGGGNPSPSELPDLQIETLELNIDSDGLASVVIKSRQFKKAVIQNVKVAQKEKKLG